MRQPTLTPFTFCCCIIPKHDRVTTLYKPWTTPSVNLSKNSSAHAHGTKFRHRNFKHFLTKYFLLLIFWQYYKFFLSIFFVLFCDINVNNSDQNKTLFHTKYIRSINSGTTHSCKYIQHKISINNSLSFFTNYIHFKVYIQHTDK